MRKRSHYFTLETCAKFITKDRSGKWIKLTPEQLTAYFLKEFENRKPQKVKA
jgi:hypothetical protein